MLWGVLINNVRACGVALNLKLLKSIIFLKCEKKAFKFWVLTYAIKMQVTLFWNYIPEELKDGAERLDSPRSLVPKISASFCLRTLLWSKKRGVLLNHTVYCEILGTAPGYPKHWVIPLSWFVSSPEKNKECKWKVSNQGTAYIIMSNQNYHESFF